MQSGQLPPDQAARVVAAMRELRETRYGGVNVALGRAIRRSGAAVGAMLQPNPKSRPSYETAARVAELLGVKVDALLYGTASTGAPIAPDRYPARASALRRLAGMLSPEIEERIRAIVLDETEPPLTETKWIRLALKWNEEHAEEAQLRRIART